MSLQFGIPLMLVAALIQATILPHLRIYSGQPDLVVVIVLAWTVLDRGQEGMIWAFIGGLILDIFSGAPMGITSLVLVPVTFLFGLTETQIYQSNILLSLAFAVVGTVGFHLTYVFALRFIAGISLVWWQFLFYVTLPSVFFDLVLMVPALRLLAPWYNRLHPRQVRL
jgi:rod shape-determining protein MreD